MTLCYSIRVDGEPFWDGECTVPPAPGDQVLIEGEYYLVQRRVWEQACELGRAWCRSREVSETYLAHVELHCIKVVET